MSIKTPNCVQSQVSVSVRHLQVRAATHAGFSVDKSFARLKSFPSRLVSHCFRPKAVNCKVIAGVYLQDRSKCNNVHLWLGAATLTDILNIVPRNTAYTPRAHTSVQTCNVICHWHWKSHCVGPIRQLMCDWNMIGFSCATRLSPSI